MVERISFDQEEADYTFGKVLASLVEREYDESQHPRDEHGRWTDSGSAPEGSIADFGEGGVPHAEHVTNIAREVKNNIGYHGPIVTTTIDPPLFGVAGQQYRVAGTANLQSGLIKLYTKGMKWHTNDEIAGIVAHEIEHQKFQRAKAAHDAEFKALMEKYPPDPLTRPEIMRADGLLNPPYDKEFPNYQDFEKYYHLPDTNELRQGDGVSGYSFDWWKAQLANESNKEQAVHETLAEMAKEKYLTGKFPTHVGPSLLRFRPSVDGEPAPKPSQAEQDRLTKMWRDLYDAVERISERIKK
jgi:SprT-like family